MVRFLQIHEVVRQYPSSTRGTRPEPSKCRRRPHPHRAARQQQCCAPRRASTRCPPAYPPAKRLPTAAAANIKISARRRRRHDLQHIGPCASIPVRGSDSQRPRPHTARGAWPGGPRPFTASDEARPASWLLTAAHGTCDDTSIAQLCLPRSISNQRMASTLRYPDGHDSAPESLDSTPRSCNDPCHRQIRR